VRGPLVLVPMPDWWRERPVGTSTNAGRKVLTSTGFTLNFQCVGLECLNPPQCD